MTKIQLTISPGYVDDWTVVEAVRELFQNALDNQTENPKNEMYFDYDGTTLSIGNKTSVLPLSSLLMGSTTKRGNGDTIGQHGEGYKIAILILLRLGKEVTFYNYGNREVWTTRLIKSRKFNNALIPEINVTSKPVWSKVPSHDLIIEVKGITPEEYTSCVENNLHLQEGVESLQTVTDRGRVLTDEKYKGKLFVNGLYVGWNPKFLYGYDVPPSSIKLDRDRRLVDTIDLSSVTSQIWLLTDEEELLAGLVSQGVWDVHFVGMYSSIYSKIDKKERIKDMVKQNFIKEHGSNAVPVYSNEELDEVIKSGQGYTPKMMPEVSRDFLTKESFSPSLRKETPKERLKKWFLEVESKLTEEEISDFKIILHDLN